MKCTTAGCNKPQIGRKENDSLSALGLTSAHCEDCTRTLLRELLSLASDTTQTVSHLRADTRTKQVA